MQRAAAVILAAALFGCSGAEGSGANNDNFFARTDQGSSIGGMKRMGTCLLILKSSPGEMHILHNRNGNDITLFVKNSLDDIDDAKETATWAFEAERLDGSIDQFESDKATVISFSYDNSFSSEGPIELLKNLAEYRSLTFRFDGAVASKATAKPDWSQEAAQMAKCIGTPLNELTAEDETEAKD